MISFYRVEKGVFMIEKNIETHLNSKFKKYRKILFDILISIFGEAHKAYIEEALNATVVYHIEKTEAMKL